jgi:uncharacterized membrane protein YdjX (TVP38/TMEM64 family)
LLGLVLVAAIAGFYALGLHRELSRDAISARLDDLKGPVAEHPLLAALVFAALYVLITALSLPVASPVSLLAGALFGRWVGTALVAAAATVGAILAFLSSRYLFRDVIQRKFGEKLRKVDEGVRREGTYYLFTLRVVPLFPFWLVNLCMGLTPMRVWTYTWVSFVGMLPGTFLYVNAGRALLSALDAPGTVFTPEVVVSFALLGILPLLLRKLVPRSSPS